MQLPLRVITCVGLLCTVIVHSRGKILRFGYKFFARFTLIDGNSRLTSDNAISVAEKLTLPKCTYECMKEKTCKSINHNEVEEKCELLDTTKFDHPNKLKRSLKWKHYETDDDLNNIGELCEKLSPCMEHEVCEDTNNQPPYICRCRDGFEGDECDVYKGPGYDDKTPAPSCQALFEKFKLLPDGQYWIKDLDKRVNCTRRVDGGYSSWSTYDSCSVSCGEGVQVRKRTCTRPVPKGGGKTCKRLGEDTQIKECRTYCHCSSALQSGKSTAHLTIGNLNEIVECGTYKGKSATYFSHDSEKMYHFRKSNPKKSRTINYNNTIEFVHKAIEMFQNCEQRFDVVSRHQARSKSYFQNTKMDKLYVEKSDCIGCKVLFVNNHNVKRGDGYISNKKYLPVKRMTFLDTDGDHEYVKITLDKLKCW